MATRRKVTVQLPEQLGRFAADAVTSGRYESLDEVVRDGVRLLMDRERERSAALKALRRKIDEGVKAADAGDVLSSDRFFADLRRRSRKPRKAG
jgi:antitoxin ParD1/3/4